MFFVNFMTLFCFLRALCGFAVCSSAYSPQGPLSSYDFLINPTKQTAKRVLAVLKKFGFGKLTISESDLLDPEMVIMLGFPPVRIDLLTSLGTAKFDDLYKKKSVVRLGRVKTHVVSFEHLIASKKESGCPKDLADLVALRKARGKRK
jgi:hypothetical protein